jgi:hypothetical protein
MGQSASVPMKNHFMFFGLFLFRVPMKSKTRAFIDTLKLLENLTDAQIKELARLALSL